MRIGIKWRLTLWYSLLALLSIIAFCIFIYLVFSKTLLDQTKISLEEDARRAAAETEIVWNAVKLKTDFAARQTTIIVYSEDNRILLGRLPNGMELESQLSDQGIYRVNTLDNSWFVYDLPLSRLRYTGWVRAIKPLSPIYQTLYELTRIMVVSIPVLFFILIIGGFQLAKKAFSPISSIVATAKKIGNGDLSKRIGLVGINDEIGELANTLDEMLNRLEDSFLREKQFANDASHELRTPVSVIMSYAEEALSCDKTKEQYKTSINVMFGESQKIHSIITQLLMLAHSYEGQSKPLFENIDVSDLVEMIAEEMKPQCDKKEIELCWTIEKNIFTMADQTLLARIIVNLIENAVKYNRPNGKIFISVTEFNKKIIISVADNGIGISTEELPMIFNRFYRVDKARSKISHGLGLSLVKWMVESHGGTIQVESELGQGTKFIVLLPKRYLNDLE